VRSHRESRIKLDARIFPITYAAARLIVKKAGDLVGVHIKPHDLRRHAATYASRSGAPLEIVSKVLLRHSNLSTNQRYWGDSATSGKAGGLLRLIILNQPLPLSSASLTLTARPLQNP